MSADPDRTLHAQIFASIADALRELHREHPDWTLADVIAYFEDKIGQSIDPASVIYRKVGRDPAYADPRGAERPGQFGIAYPPISKSAP